MHLVLLETSGNQSYIFATNKLRENVGASELIHRVGTRLILKAVAQLNQTDPNAAQLRVENNAALRQHLLDSALNPRIEDDPSLRAEIIIATSGKALILVKEHADGKAIIQSVTREVLSLAPGLDICGVISDAFDWNDPDFTKTGLATLNREVHQRINQVRSRRPSPATRFLRLPIIADCATSSYPAAKVETFKQDLVLRSQVSLSKHRAYDQGIDRINALLEHHKPGVNLLQSISSFDRELSDNGSSQTIDWLAVVHADGNGFGEVFLNFGNYVRNNREYVTKYREFSIALDICTEKAFLNALDIFIPTGTTTALLPIVPLILGGDDLTVVCDGRYALKFTHRFLQEFERLTQTAIAPEDAPLKHPQIIAQIAKQASGSDRFSACAGVAIVKPHFPFSTAYHLAEDLIRSAKMVKTKIKTPCSALDYHILYDSSGGNLSDIRHKLQPDRHTYLWSKPYLITPPELLQNSTDSTWIHQHHWQQLQTKVNALLSESDDGKRNLPNSQIHQLREGLFLGRVGADARYQLISHRYDRSSSRSELPPSGIRTLEAEPETLFWQDTKDEQVIYTTGLLDAMDAASFWEGQS
jgi:hypothetical protein